MKDAPQLSLNSKTERAVKARFSRLLDVQLLRFLLLLIAISCLFGWGWLVFIEAVSVGHLLLIVLSITLMPLLWYYGELRDLKPSGDLTAIEDVSAVLDRKLLMNIKGDESPQSLAVLVSAQPGGRFFASRFAIGGDLLKQMTSDEATETALVWRQAISLAQLVGRHEIDSSALTAALLLASPHAEPVLARLQLDKEDVVAGVKWYRHIEQTIERHQKKRHYGGIGRDLAFGWAPLLNHVGFNITNSIQSGGFLQRPVASRMQTIDRILHLLSQSGRRNAALVGEIGVGKTTIIYTLAQKLIEQPDQVPADLRYHQVVSLDAAHLIANTRAQGELEHLLLRIFNEAAAAKNVIIFLDEAQLFLKQGTGSVDLSQLLLPVLEGGGLRLILSLSEQEWLGLSQANPGLAQLLNRVVLKPLEQEETLQVLEDQTILLEGRHRVVYMHQSLQRAYDLADRFIHELAFPGKAVKLLEAAAGFPEQQYFITSSSVEQAAEQSFDVKVQTANTQVEKDTLLNLEQRIHERMINQGRAVKLVSDALRRARTGVRNEQKPIGTFLFLGPTGVGKTELSKALADIYFGGEDRLVRVDLNEFSGADDTRRLLAAGADDPYSLCAQISKQPFSVVLLDEIEKAHPNVLNLLLQMLDEGVLRDAANRPISFRDAIIIATSNAGADQIRQHIDRGEQLEQFEGQFVDELIDAAIFRPEFLNRFDEIILFRPLSKEELLQVVDLLIAGINKSLAARKVQVSLTTSAKELMVERGYDPRLGARPLRRVVQRAVENVVAQRLLRDAIIPGQAVELDAPELLEALQDRQ